MPSLKTRCRMQINLFWAVLKRNVLFGSLVTSDENKSRSAYKSTDVLRWYTQCRMYLYNAILSQPLNDFPRFVAKVTDTIRRLVSVIFSTCDSERKCQISQFLLRDGSNGTPTQLPWSGKVDEVNDRYYDNAHCISCADVIARV